MFNDTRYLVIEAEADIVDRTAYSAVSHKDLRP